MRAAAASQLRCGGEIHHGSSHMVEIVGEDVECRVGDDFGDVAVGEPVGAEAGHIGIRDATAFGNYFLREGQGGLRLRVGGLGRAGGERFFAGQPGFASCLLYTSPSPRD